MKPEDKTSEIIKAVKAKHEKSKKKTEYVIEKDYKNHFKKGAKVKLTPANYKIYKEKGLVK